MEFNKHYNLKDKHAFLSPSQYHWINYSQEKLADRWRSNKAKEFGVAMHALACDCIKLGVGLSDIKTTVNMYVNDALYFGMTPEQPLYYSPYCFGTADAISFSTVDGEAKPVLRIHDLKTGTVPASMNQLYIYAAIFCLEYGVRPEDIKIVLRIYQNEQIMEDIANPSHISEIIEKIIEFDAVLMELENR